MTDTIDPPNVSETADGSSATEPEGGSFVAPVLLGFGALLGLIAGAALFIVQLPYFALEPGNTFETESFIEVEGAESFTSPGEVSFVTVTQRRLSPIDWIVSQFQSSDEVFHEDVLLGGRSLEEQREENAQLMLSSQSTAIAAALNHLGFVTADPAGVVIIDVLEDGPLDGVLARNDVITEIDGVSITTAMELVDALDAAEAGDSVTVLAGRPGETPQTFDLDIVDDTAGFLGIARDAETSDEQPGATISEVVEGGPVEGLLEDGDRIVSLDGEAIDSFEALVEVLADRRAGEQVRVEVVRSEGTDEEVVSVDVVLGTRSLERAGLQFVDTQFRDADLPFSVNFTTEDIGGPSAGLAFTLTVLDVLTEGDLTGGANIVVTGAIDRNGNITAIGGVHQKAFAADDVDADVFIVPEANFDAAVAALPDLRVEPASTLTEALEIIEEFGGNVSQLPTDGRL